MADPRINSIYGRLMATDWVTIRVDGEGNSWQVPVTPGVTRIWVGDQVVWEAPAASESRTIPGQSAAAEQKAQRSQAAKANGS